MSEQKFDPVKEFVNLRDSLSKTVGEGLRTVTGVGPLVFPAVDMYETENSVVIYTEPLVGAEASSIEVGMEDDVLTISGKTEPQINIEDTAYLHRELRFGAFSREIRIPRKVKADAAAASFKKGVLTITLPKIEEKGKGQIITVTPAE